MSNRIVRTDGEFRIVNGTSDIVGTHPTQAEAVTALGVLEGFKVAKGLLPEALSWTSVRAGLMPNTNIDEVIRGSGLPQSLEQDVPPRFQFWKADGEDAMRTTRDALVEAQIFTPGSIMIVNGEIRRVVIEREVFLAKVDDTPSPLEPRPELEVVVAKSVHAPGQDLTVVSAEIVDALSLEKIPELLEKRTPWVCIVPDGSDATAVIRKAASCSFRIRTRGGVSFATSVDELVDSDLVVPVIEKTWNVSLVQVGKAATEGAPELQYVLGVVLEPDPVTNGEPGDLQKDTYDAETIRASAHRYMKDFQNVGLMHKRMINNLATVVESYIAPVNMNIAGKVVKAGSWLMGIMIGDAKVWTDVKSGALTGLSIGGDALTTPVQE